MSLEQLKIKIRYPCEIRTTKDEFDEKLKEILKTESFHSRDAAEQYLEKLETEL